MRPTPWCWGHAAGRVDPSRCPRILTSSTYLSIWAARSLTPRAGMELPEVLAGDAGLMAIDSVAQSWVSGSSRTREATGSITTIAPRSRGSRCSRSAVITSPPISEGRILWARTCTTLGPVAPLRASSRLVEIVGEDDVALGSGPIEYLGVIGPRVSDRAPVHCFDSLRFEVLSPQWREIHVDEELQAVPTGSSCSSTRQAA